MSVNFISLAPDFLQPITRSHYTWSKQEIFLQNASCLSKKVFYLGKYLVIYIIIYYYIVQIHRIV